MPEIPKGSFIAATYIEVRDQTKIPEFIQLVRGSIDQGRVNRGLLHIDTLSKPPRYYTRSVWRSREDMYEFRNKGAHAKAMGRARFLSEEIITTHWIGDAIPGWDEVIERISEEWGRQSGGF